MVTADGCHMTALDPYLHFRCDQCGGDGWVLASRAGCVLCSACGEVRHEALHEVLHMMEWPLYEEATKRMNAGQTEAFRVNVWEPHTHEMTRRLAPYILGG